MTSNIALWYSARATGLVSLLLLTSSVVLGILGPVGAGRASGQRFVIGAIHRNIALLTVTFLTVHIGSSVIDSYAGIGWWDAVVPFGSVYRPFWLGLGAVAFDLMLALIATSLLRPRINARFWRAVHWTAYLCWPVALIHSWGTGTDTSHGWALLLTIGSLVVAAGAGLTRLVAAGQPARGVGART